MKIISFAWTTPAVEAEIKTCTRRDWPDHYARLFSVGEPVQAWSAAPRFGGKKVRVIRLTELTKERLCDAPPDDWVKEGFAFLEANGLMLGKLSPRQMWEGWKLNESKRWVVRFDYDTAPLFSFFDMGRSLRD